MAALYFVLRLDRPNALGIVPLFHFDEESNLPTLFSGVQLAMASMLAFLIAGNERTEENGSPRHWFAIGCLLAFLGIDDMAHLHENLDVIIMSRVNTSGLIHWPWVLPYAGLVIAVIVIFFPFYLRLPGRLRLFFALSAGFYVFGAIGMEMLGANHAEQFGETTGTYSLFMTIEESCEMLSVTLLIYGLLSHLSGPLGGLPTQIQFTGASHPDE